VGSCPQVLLGVLVPFFWKTLITFFLGMSPGHASVPPLISRRSLFTPCSFSDHFFAHLPFSSLLAPERLPVKDIVLVTCLPPLGISLYYAKGSSTMPLQRTFPLSLSQRPGLDSSWLLGFPPIRLLMPSPILWETYRPSLSALPVPPWPTRGLATRPSFNDLMFPFLFPTHIPLHPLI